MAPSQMERKKRLSQDTRSVDIKKKKIVSLEVTSEEIHDGSRLKNLVDNALENNTLKIVIVFPTSWHISQGFVSALISIMYISHRTFNTIDPSAAEGVDLLCYLTPAEHLALPTAEEVKEGLISRAYRQIILCAN